MHLDGQAGEGIDVVADIASDGFDPSVIGTFDLVLCTNLLEHVLHREQTIQYLFDLAAPNAYVVVTVPKKFPYHEDPIDTMYRPTPKQLGAALRRVNPSSKIEREAVVSVTDPKWYKSRKALLRRYVLPLRWQTSCVIARCP